MATENLELSYLTINQAQKEEVFNDNMNILDQEINDLGTRVTSLESGSGVTGYDDTELRNRITQNELDISALEQTDISMTSDIESLQTLTGQHSSQIGSLQTNYTNVLNRLENVEDNDFIQDTEINDLEDRVIILENAGGSGYNDTELRNRIIINEDDIVSLNSLYTDLNTRVDTIESVNSTQNITLDSYGLRITDLEEASQFDPTPIENRLTTVEQDLSTVKTNQTNIQNDFSSLESNVNTFDNRITTNESEIDAIQLSDSNQDTEISELDTRVTTLEQSGGSSYDDTELRNRITTNESEIDSLQLSDTTQNQDIDALELTSQDHETRITTLEQNSGTGGGDMPQTGEIRKFSRAHIPINWYEISKIRDLNTKNFYSNDFIKKDLEQLGGQKIKHTSYNTYMLSSLFNNNSLRILTKDQGQVLLNSDIGFNSSYEVNIFQNNPNNMYILKFNSEDFTLLDYDLNANNYTSNTIPFINNSGQNITQNRRCTLVNKEHTFAYRLYTISNNALFVFKIDLVNKTCDTAYFDENAISTAYNGNFWSHSDTSLVYFNDLGNICFSRQTGGDGIILDTSTLTFSYASTLVTASSVIFSNISGSNSYFENFWIGDNQFIFNEDEDRFIMIENYTTFKSEDLMNIDMNYIKNVLGVLYFYMIIDQDKDLFFYSRESSNNEIYNAIISNNKIDGTQSIENYKVVDCIYNVQQ